MSQASHASMLIGRHRLDDLDQLIRRAIGGRRITFEDLWVGATNDHYLEVQIVEIDDRDFWHLAGELDGFGCALVLEEYEVGSIGATALGRREPRLSELEGIAEDLKRWNWKQMHPPYEPGELQDAIGVVLAAAKGVE